jgi:hypothetical protein
MKREVWAFHEAEITLWLEGAGQTKVGSPLLVAERVVDISLVERPITFRKGQPGNTSATIAVADVVRVLKFSNLHISKTVSQTFADRANKYQIEVSFVNERYVTEPNDLYPLKTCSLMDSTPFAASEEEVFTEDFSFDVGEMP